MPKIGQAQIHCVVQKAYVRVVGLCGLLVILLSMLFSYYYARELQLDVLNKLTSHQVQFSYYSMGMTLGWEFENLEYFSESFPME